MKDKIENKRETVCTNYSTVTIFSITCVHVHVFCFLGRISLCIWGWPQTSYSPALASHKEQKNNLILSYQNINLHLIIPLIVIIMKNQTWHSTGLGNRLCNPEPQRTHSANAPAQLFTKTCHCLPDSSLKEVKLINICTLTSPQPFTKSRKSSAVKSSKEFFGSTSNRPFLMA